MFSHTGFTTSYNLRAKTSVFQPSVCYPYNEIKTDKGSDDQAKITPSLSIKKKPPLKNISIIT